MIDSARSPAPERGLAALGRAARPSPLLEVTVTGSPREAHAPAQRPPAAELVRELPRRARSRSRTREISELIIE